MSALIFREGTEPKLVPSPEPLAQDVSAGWDRTSQGPGHLSGGSPTRDALLRAADLGAAGALLLLTLPLSLLVALALRLEAPGPVLQRQPHLGRAGQRFNLLTFRSTVEGPFRRPVTSRVGQVIRPARIDQLPVLLNLLRGDMTLFGPAPLPTPGQREAHLAPGERPGLSGWVGAD